MIRRALYCLITFLLFTPPVTLLAAESAWMSRTGTIANAVAQSNEILVYLDAVTVDKIRAADGYFVIHEPWDAQSRIVVLTQPPSAIRMGQMVDIEGTVDTLVGGQRVILDASVIGYFDESEHLLLHPPFMKGFMQPTPWAYKMELTNLGQEGQSGLLDFPPEPDPDPLPPPTFYASIADLLNDDPPDDTIVQLDCHPVESVESGYFVMGDDGGQDTLAVYYTDPQSRRVNVVTGTMATDGNDRVLNVDSGPCFDPQGYVGHVTYVTDETIQWVRTFADDTELVIGESESEKSGVVTAVFPAVDCFYMQTTPTPIAGIRVDYTGDLPAEGDEVTVTGGTVTTDEGERVISGPSDVDTTDTETFSPLGMNHKTLGGGPFDQYTPGVTGGVGLYSLGLFVRIYGRVTAVGIGCFYVDDGSGVPNDISQPGLKVSWAFGFENGYPPIEPPGVGAFVQVDGISGSELYGSSLIRVLHLRKPEDIVVVPAYPSIAITKPSGEEIHRPEGQTTLTIAGTTSANGGPSVTLVKVKIFEGHDHSAPLWDSEGTTASGTTSWSHDWTDVTTGEYTIWALAKNEEGLMADVSRNVTVSDIPYGVIFVDCNKTDGTGHSWNSPRNTISGGLATAAQGDETEIWVADGTYFENVVLADGIAIYGGFTGDTEENYREWRNWIANNSILDGQTVGPPIVDAENITDAVLDGFIIRNSDGGGDGGGIYCYNSTCLFSHNVITHCMGYYGGGLYLEDSTVTVADNVIISNSAAEQGYAIYCDGGTDCIVNNTIIGNYGYNDSGAIYIAGSPTIKNNIIAYNESYGIVETSGNPTYQTNDVYGNSLGNYSGVTNHGTDINTDPGLIWGYGADLHIRWDSPCRDAGTNVQGMPSQDIDGEARVYPIDGDIDIGADEWNASDHALRIVRVKTDGDDENDGSTWELAKQTVAGALTAAGQLGGEVWVASGTYHEQVRIESFVGLYGGFEGTETDRSERDWETNVTTIDADSQGYASAVTMTDGFFSVLDGFTVTEGNGTYGGGVICARTCKIWHNTIQNCVTAAEGGGIYISDLGSGQPEIRWNRIQLNTASNEGGGIMCNDSAIIEGNVFDSNYGVNHGGAIAMHGGYDIYIANNLFIRNHTDAPTNVGGGAIQTNFDTHPIIVNNTFVENYVGTGTWPNITPLSYGGAVLVRRTTYQNPVILVNNIFYGNLASHGTCVACTISNYYPSYATVSYCDAYPDPGAAGYYYADTGCSVTVDANSCRYVDPLFCAGAYWLDPDSLLRTTYHGSSASPAPTEDIEGQTRPGTDGYTDMGAYENDGRECP